MYNGHCPRFALALVLTGAVMGGLQPRAAGQVTHFGLESQQPGEEGEYRGLLGRELLRQAVLLTAREHLGWFTRDATLLEPLPKGEHAVVVHPRTIIGPKRVELVLNGPGNDQPLRLRRKWDGTAHAQILARLIPLAERWARTKLPAYLSELKNGRAATTQQTTHPAEPEGPLQEKIAKQLRHMSVLSQYNAVRHSHRRARTTGMSPQLMGALVRGYANLGQLTRFHWNGSGPAFHSRALLYAQRLVESMGRTRFALSQGNCQLLCSSLLIRRLVS